jgi:hypothetical protein
MSLSERTGEDRHHKSDGHLVLIAEMKNGEWKMEELIFHLSFPILHFVIDILRGEGDASRRIPCRGQEHRRAFLTWNIRARRAETPDDRVSPA